MDQSYFLGRMNESLAMAGAAKSGAAKLVHFDLAGRYSVAANAAAQESRGPQPSRRWSFGIRPAYSSRVQQEFRATCTGRPPGDMLARCDAASC